MTQEFFHRETLAPVTFIGKGFATVAVRGPVGPAFDVTETEFRDNYVRNESVTLELLERMGWECETFTDTAEGGVLSRGVIDLPDDNDFRIYFRDGNPLSATVISGGEVPIPFPATLRDLLNVLRVFGMESSVPTAPAENPTV